MKNFDLNACGVQEMNAAEVVEVNGGFNDYMDGNFNNHHGLTGGGMSFGETAWWSWLLFHGVNG